MMQSQYSVGDTILIVDSIVPDDEKYEGQQAMVLDVVKVGVFANMSDGEVVFWRFSEVTKVTNEKGGEA